MGSIVAEIADKLSGATAGITVGVDGAGHDVKFFGATSGSYIQWDESADSLLLTDSTPIKIGDGLDMTIYHNGSNSFITNAIGALNIATLTSGIAINIGHTTSEVTINDNLTVTGDLTVDGTTITINSTTLTVDDKNIEMGSVATPSDTTADGGGLTLKGATDKTILWTNSLDSWVFNQGITVGVDNTGHDVKFFGATSGKYWLWDESADEVVAVSDLQQTGTITVGIDDTGHDVKFFGATASRYVEWDESADQLNIHGKVAQRFGSAFHNSFHHSWAMGG